MLLPEELGVLEILIGLGVERKETLEKTQYLVFQI